MERMSIMEVTTIDIPAQTVIGIRRRGHYRDIATILSEIYNYAVQNNIVITGAPIYLSHEMSADEAIEADKAGNADLEVTFPIAEKTETSGGILCYELLGGKMARIVHKGPYDTVEPAYERLFTWIGQNNLTIAGPIREVYVSDPSTTAPEEIMTEILAPVA